MFSAGVVTVVTPEMLRGLPAPVRRYLELSDVLGNSPLILPGTIIHDLPVTLG